MELRYANGDLERVCTEARLMQKRLGADVAKKLQLRIKELERVQAVDDLLRGTGKWEQLKADRAGQWSARLDKKLRLIVEPDDNDQSAVIIEITNYH